MLAIELVSLWVNEQNCFDVTECAPAYGYLDFEYDLKLVRNFKSIKHTALKISIDWDGSELFVSTGGIVGPNLTDAKYKRYTYEASINLKHPNAFETLKRIIDKDIAAYKSDLGLHAPL